MNRRGFFRSLVGVAATAATAGIVLPELWVPKRTFFLPPVGGWAGNRLLTPAMIVNEALRVLGNNLAFTASVDRAYDDAFTHGAGYLRVHASPAFPHLKTQHIPYAELNGLIDGWQA